MSMTIPCTLMRGGTSRGPFFLSSDLPVDNEARAKVLLAAMGNSAEVDGVGGSSSLTHKVAIVSISREEGADLDYLFAQVSTEAGFVDFSPSCGNMLSGVVPFAIDRGLIQAQASETVARVRNVNTGSIIEVVVPTPGGRFTGEGSASIDGVPGVAAPITLNFLDVGGTKTGQLFPTGCLKEVIEGIEVSCVDAAVPMVLMPAKALGKTGYESKAELDVDTTLLEKIEAIRLAASLKMGLGDATGKVIPKVGLLAAPAKGGNLSSRYFVPDSCHGAHAVTGAICIGSAALIPGTVAHELAVLGEDPSQINLEHPSGKISLSLQVNEAGLATQIPKAGLIRTARKIFSGELHIEES